MKTGRPPRHHMRRRLEVSWQQIAGAIYNSFIWPRRGKCKGWHEYKTTKPRNLIATVNDAAVQRKFMLLSGRDRPSGNLPNQRSVIHQWGSGIQVPWLFSFINWKEQIDETDSVNLGNLGNFVDD
jgi:hypothetical protein